MNARTRRKYSALPLRDLVQLRDDLTELIQEIHDLPDKREIDILEDHTGERELIHEIVDVEGVPGERRWTQWEEIYCSPQKCPKCPHGPYMFTYRSFKTRPSRIVSRGIPFFDIRILKEMEQHVEIGIVGTLQRTDPSDEDREDESTKTPPSGDQ